MNVVIQYILSRMGVDFPPFQENMISSSIVEMVEVANSQLMANDEIWRDRS